MTTRPKQIGICFSSRGATTEAAIATTSALAKAKAAQLEGLVHHDTPGATHLQAH